MELRVRRVGVQHHPARQMQQVVHSVAPFRKGRPAALGATRRGDEAAQKHGEKIGQSLDQLHRHFAHAGISRRPAGGWHGIEAGEIRAGAEGRKRPPYAKMMAASAIKPCPAVCPG